MIFYKKTIWPPVRTLLLILAVFCSGLIYANDVTERRVQISIPVFPRVVAVDNEFQKKLTNDEQVLLVFLYDSDKNKALQLAGMLHGKLNNVAGLKFVTKVVSVTSQLMSADPVPTAMFVAERLPQKAFEVAVEYAIRNQRLLYSPYIGDVERGATAGISITSRVNPYFNLKTLESSNIKINTLLMNLSKVYE